VPTDYEHDRYIFAGQVPGLKPRDPARWEMPRFSHRLMNQEPIITEGGGWVRHAHPHAFPGAPTISARLVNLEPGAMRELHCTNKTNGNTTSKAAGASAGKARTFNYQAGDVGAIPKGMAHYVQNLGDEPLRYLEIFRNPCFREVSLNQ